MILWNDTASLWRGVEGNAGQVDECLECSRGIGLQNAAAGQGRGRLACCRRAMASSISSGSPEGRGCFDRLRGKCTSSSSTWVYRISPGRSR